VWCRGSRRPRVRQRLARGVPVSRAMCKLTRGGVRPSSEAETCPRGCQALKQGGDSAAQRWALKRDGDSPEGYCDRPFGGPLRLLGPWALLCFGPRPREAFFVVCGLFVLPLTIFREGCFPRLLEDPYGCPRY
jgi:hypothetical protein